MPVSEQVIVELKAEIGKLRSDLEQGKKEVKKFGDKAGDNLKQVGKVIAGVFATQKIIQFFKTGITEAAKFERSMTLLTNKVEDLGSSFEDTGAALEDYIRRTEAATRFSKFELAAALDNLVLKTGDLNTALTLNEKAMDFAVAANISLEQAAEALALAYEGNTSGLSQMARLLGVSTENAKDAQLMFDLLEQKVAGAARAEEGLAVELDKLNNSLNDAAEILGTELGPSFVWLANTGIPKATAAVQFMVKGFQSLGVIMGTIVLTAVNAGKALANMWRGPGKALDQFRRDQEAVLIAMTEESEAIWKKQASDKERIDEESLDKSIKVKKKEVKETEKAAAKMLKLEEQNLADRSAIFTTFLTQNEAQWFEYNQATGEITQAGLDRLQAASAAAAGTIASTMEEFVANAEEQAITFENFFKNMGRGMVKAIANAIAASLEAEAAGYLARGVAAAIGIVTAGAAPGLFAAGASLAAAAGTVRGLGEKFLAEGGVVTEPTRAVIGEAGPEAVIPLDRAGIGGLAPIDMSGARIQMVFPGVRNASDVASARFAQTTERQLAEATQRLNQRKGVKV